MDLSAKIEQPEFTNFDSFRAKEGEASWVLYQSRRLLPYSNRLIHAFTAKPLPIGGSDLSSSEVEANRRSLLRALGIAEVELAVPRQVHGDTIKTAGNPPYGGADAVIVHKSGDTALIQVADCVPILLYAPDRHIGAVIHAGWRGTAVRIVAKTVAKLIEEYEADAKQMIGLIGPAIGGCCYEVSDEVAAALSDSVSSRTPLASYRTLNANGRPQIDLQTINEIQLQSTGVEIIDKLPLCTQCHPEILWSYRRSDSMRQGVIVSLK